MRSSPRRPAITSRNFRCIPSVRPSWSARSPCTPAPVSAHPARGMLGDAQGMLGGCSGDARWMLRGGESACTGSILSQTSHALLGRAKSCLSFCRDRRWGPQPFKLGGFYDSTPCTSAEETPPNPAPAPDWSFPTPSSTEAFSFAPRVSHGKCYLLNLRAVPVSACSGRIQARCSSGCSQINKRCEG